jgi:flagellar basal-body rod protein FlgF
MDPFTISVASGLQSRLESLDLLANNLANSSAAGFKKDAESYSLYLSPEALDSQADDDPVTATIPVIEHQWTDFSQGLLEETGNPLDLALTGDGYFAVDGKDGPLYTRNGRLRVSGDGSLVTVDGQKVRMAGGGAAQLSSLDPITVSSSGVISQKGQALGTLELVRFVDRAGLVKAGSNYFRSGQTPQAASDAEVLQGKVEGSNVNASESAVRLINVMRQFEMLTKAAMINAEMNRKATDEVARPGS